MISNYIATSAMITIAKRPMEARLYIRLLRVPLLHAIKNNLAHPDTE